MRLDRLQRSLLLPALLFVLALTGCARPEPESAPGPSVPVSYPVSERVDQIDTYHGVEVADPYRWLEEVDGEETAQWVAAENAVALPFLEAIPAREEINQRLTEVWNYERFKTRSRRAGAISTGETTASRTRTSSTSPTRWTARPVFSSIPTPSATIGPLR